MSLATVRLRRLAGFTTALAVIGIFGLASPAVANRDTAPGQQTAAAPSGADSTNASQGGQAPPGNNGTVKINDSAVDDGPNNEPHVACTFWVNFYGYDAGSQSATMTFDPWAPTSGGHSVTFSTSWTIDQRTGGNQLDKAYGPVDLSSALAGITPHPKQGYHVKLTVHVTGSQGSDVKHKVFWIQPCQTAGSSAVLGEQQTKGSTAVSGTETEHADTSAGSTAVLGESISRAAVATPAPAAAASGSGTQVLGESISRSPSALARTGASIAQLLIVALALLGIGLLLVRTSRARRDLV